jgi:hypothetical protein
MAFGQKNTATMAPKHSVSFDKKAPHGVISEPKGIILWQNDFSDPTQWSNSNFPGGTPPHSAGDWTITTNLSAIPVPALVPAAHTTAANGYAHIDSDGAGATETQNAQIVFNQNIDLSAEPLVVMVFQQSHRRYAESTYVVYSTNGGATWQEVEVNAGMTVNTNTTNPATVQVNLSSQIGGQDSVRIGFKYTGQYDWFWAVDDVKLMQPDDYDLAVTGVYWGSTGTWGARMPYYKIPTAQVTEINFGGIISNFGALNQTAQFGVQATPYISGSAPTLVVAGTFDTLECSAAFTPAATVTNYTVSCGVQSANTDANPADNTIANAATIGVNNSIYARDLGTYASGSYNQGMGFEVGNIFDIFGADELSAIDVYLHPNTNPGTEMFVKLYSIDPATGDFVFVDESSPYVVTGNDIDALVTLPLAGGAVALNAGEPYLVVAYSNGDGGATDDLVVGTAGVSASQTSFYYDMTNTTWYYTTSTPMVRMNFSNASISENNTINTFNVSPNPANGNATIALTGNSGAEVAISIVDLTGKEVYNTALSALNGSATISVDTQKFGNGLYMVTVSSNGSAVTKKLVVKN